MALLNQDRRGFVQLFAQPHPKRRTAWTESSRRSAAPYVRERSVTGDDGSFDHGRNGGAGDDEGSLQGSPSPERPALSPLRGLDHPHGRGDSLTPTRARYMRALGFGIDGIRSGGATNGRAAGLSADGSGGGGSVGGASDSAASLDSGPLGDGGGDVSGGDGGLDGDREWAESNDGVPGEAATLAAAAAVAAISDGEYGHGSDGRQSPVSLASPNSTSAPVEIMGVSLASPDPHLPGGSHGGSGSGSPPPASAPSSKSAFTLGEKFTSLLSFNKDRSRSLGGPGDAAGAKAADGTPPVVGSPTAPMMSMSIVRRSDGADRPLVAPSIAIPAHIRSEDLLGSLTHFERAAEFSATYMAGHTLHPPPLAAPGADGLSKEVCGLSMGRREGGGDQGK